MFYGGRFPDLWPALKDIASLPDDVRDVIADYGKVLEELGKEQPLQFWHPVSKLPHPKQKIEQSIDLALKLAKDPEVIMHLKNVRLALKTFIPDDGVRKANEDLLKWMQGQVQKLDRGEL